MHRILSPGRRIEEHDTSPRAGLKQQELFGTEGKSVVKSRHVTWCRGQDVTLAVQGSSAFIEGTDTAMHTYYATRDFIYVPEVDDEG